MREELLQRPHRHLGGQSDRLDALSLHICHQTVNVAFEMVERIDRREAFLESLQQRNESGPQCSNLFGIHGQGS